MQLCRAACYWFPWWVSKINIKVCDSRERLIDSRDLRAAPHLTFDPSLCSLTRRQTEETAGLVSIAFSSSLILPPPQFTVTDSDLTGMKQSPGQLMVMTCDVYCSWGYGFWQFLHALKIHRPGWWISSSHQCSDLIWVGIRLKKVNMCLVEMFFVNEAMDLFMLNFSKQKWQSVSQSKLAFCYWGFTLRFWT